MNETVGWRRAILLAVSTVPLLCGPSLCADNSGGALFPKAIVTTQDVETAIRIEWDLRKNYEVAPKEGEEWFKVIDGTSGVLVSAPHATAQIREGKSKFADAGTGALAVMLSRLAKTTTIYTVRQSPSDPNFYDDNAYKTTLGKLIERLHPRLVLDLHASHWYRPYDVDFGTMGGQSMHGHRQWLSKLSQSFGTAGFRDFSQDYFAASGNQTVTKFVSGRGVPCIQLEINETWLSLFNEAAVKGSSGDPTDIAEDIVRVDMNGAHRFSAALEGLVRYIGWMDGTAQSGHN